MSTAEVTKLLGVSRRTLMRWVSQFDMQLEKNELGHYQFSDADIEQLRQIQSQAQSNPPVQQKEEKTQTSRKGTVKTTAVVDDNMAEALTKRINDLERAIRTKADDVVSYQMLQHRKEMEELANKIASLEKKIEALENANEKQEPKENVFVFDQSSSTQKKPKRKNFISSIFSL